MDDLVRGPSLTRGSMAGDLARALTFLHTFARRRSPRTVPIPGGFAVLDDRYPGSHDDNKLIVHTAPDSGDPGDSGDSRDSGGPGNSGGPGQVVGRLVAVADEVLAERGHRLVCVDDDRLGTAYAPAFAAAGYEHETNLIMAFRGRVPRDVPPAERLDLAELVPVLRREWRGTLPQASDEVVDGLARRVEARLRGADAVSFHGVRAPDGEIASRADLYVDGGVAQIESVFTGEPHRGKGHARALMTALLAQAAEAELIFLMADANDWPRHFYADLGFEPLGHTHAFLRT
ncbi:GNAT family N-acetyltransferase [Nonomuraea insulae]|uniref:GNAT family N-acetyltransferase n=1 Tax=Nonomuraea insulae TaxID=1616787 RepID=A0ABW1CGR7_9ACTN